MAMAFKKKKEESLPNNNQHASVNNNQHASVNNNQHASVNNNQHASVSQLSDKLNSLLTNHKPNTPSTSVYSYKNDKNTQKQSNKAKGSHSSYKSQYLQQQSAQPTLCRELIIKGALFWDGKGRVQRIKSLNLSAVGLSEFEDTWDFQIRSLISIELLSLSRNSIRHVQSVGWLQTLITLNISHNQVYDISALHSLRQLQQLYASNNLIHSIAPLTSLSQLQVLNLYSNRVDSFPNTYSVLGQLSNLQQLDIQQNPCYDQQVRSRLLLLPLKRLNNQTITSKDRQIVSHQRQLDQQDGRSVGLSSKSIGSSASSILSASSIGLSASCVISPLNMSTMRQSKASFLRPVQLNTAQLMHQRLLKLQQEYTNLDDQFQEQIAKNVQLKNQLKHKQQTLQSATTLNEQNQLRTQEIKEMKRRARDLKETLFSKDKKGQLLRRLFELQVHSNNNNTINKGQNNNKNDKNNKAGSVVVWDRRFDADDAIIIIKQQNTIGKQEIIRRNTQERNTIGKELVMTRQKNLYLSEEDAYLREDSELQELLNSNSSALQALKQELRGFR